MRAARRRGLGLGGAALALALGVAPVAASNHWPTPAAGPSKSGDPEVIFSFDDGPFEHTTPFVLDALAAHHVHAIFFVVGRQVQPGSKGVAPRLALLEREVTDGHVIGNHTMTHAHMCSIKAPRATTEIDTAGALLGQLTGLPMLLFRVPYGGHCKLMVGLIAERKLMHYYWDIDPQEYKGKTGAQAAAYVIGQIKRLKGRAIVLMHDTKLATAKAVPIILDWLDAENLRRAAKGVPRIRILSGSDLLAERLDPATVSFAARTLAWAGARWRRDACALVPGRRLAAAGDKAASTR